jgi:hypothetical protein
MKNQMKNLTEDLQDLQNKLTNIEEQLTYMKNYKKCLLFLSGK